jgi:hypothetical protein
LYTRNSPFLVPKETPPLPTISSPWKSFMLVSSSCAYFASWHLTYRSKKMSVLSSRCQDVCQTYHCDQTFRKRHWLCYQTDTCRMGVIVHACDPSYLGSDGRKILVRCLSWIKAHDPIWKIKGWRHGSSARAPVQQAGGLHFKPQYKSKQIKYKQQK